MRKCLLSARATALLAQAAQIVMWRMRAPAARAIPPTFARHDINPLVAMVLFLRCDCSMWTAPFSMTYRTCTPMTRPRPAFIDATYLRQRAQHRTRRNKHRDPPSAPLQIATGCDWRRTGRRDRLRVCPARRDGATRGRRRAGPSRKRRRSDLRKYRHARRMTAVQRGVAIAKPRLQMGHTRGRGGPRAEARDGSGS